MILFCGAGRFGNQLFQLLYCESIRKPEERVFSIGLKSILSAVYGLKHYYNTDNEHFSRFADVILRRILEFLGKIKAINFIKEQDGILTQIKGVLPITYINGYFQSDCFYSQDFKECFNFSSAVKTDSYGNSVFHWKTNLVARARTFIDEKCPENMTPVFIHIRHGDYPDDIRLPDNYYFNAYQKILEQTNGLNTHFFILGDSPSWAEDFFTFIPSKTISRNNAMTDFFIMTECSGGIISNSTFAWWGAYLCKKGLPIIAPRYWMDWNHNKWYPQKIETNAFQFIYVQK